MREVLQELERGWPFLAAYYLVTIPLVVFLWRRYRISRFLYPFKSRMILAAVLAAIFTPSLVGDFWLFSVPGPAIAGLLLILPAIIFAPEYIVVALTYYIIPLGVAFYIVRFLLWVCERHRVPPRQIA